MSSTAQIYVPKYRLHRASGQAIVTLGGRDHYLGKHGSASSRRKYEKAVSEFLAADRSTGIAPADQITVEEVIAAFWRHAKTYYVDADGSPTKEQSCYKYAIKPLRHLYGETLAAEFGPLALKAVREKMIDSGWARTYVNHQVNRVRRLFKWATENELIPAGVFQRLQTVTGLRYGRCKAKETDPVRPVQDEHVDAVRPFVSRQVWAMIELQRLTGMRSGEVVLMRSCDLDRSNDVWTYSPARHKTKYRGHVRTVYLGPQAQEIVRAFLKPDLEAYLFSPVDAESERRAVKTNERITPLSCGNHPGTNRKRRPRKTPGEHYTSDSYRRAIEYGIKKADVPHWHPHQLRHSAATNLRREFGLEAARIILGHKTAAITEIYAEVDHAKAIEVATKAG